MTTLSNNISNTATTMHNDLSKIYGLTTSAAGQSTENFYSSILAQSQSVSAILSGLVADNETVMTDISKNWTEAKTYYDEF
jgi:hypothetical protein